MKKQLLRHPIVNSADCSCSESTIGMSPNQHSQQISNKMDRKQKVTTTNRSWEGYVGDLNETYQSEKGEKGQKEDIFGGGTFEQVKEKNEPSPMTRSKMD